ncbi:MAG: hypothetical protein ABH834_02580 [Candidatus Altiarchaeota archaeon]
MKTSRKIRLALIILLALTPQVSAMWWSIFYNTIQEVFEIIAFGLMGIVEATGIVTAALIQTNPCVYAGTLPTDQCPHALAYTGSLPVDATIRSMNALFIRAFMPVYVTFFLILGLYMIFMQGSPKGRAEAKAFLIDLVVGMILVGLSPVIFQVILDISAFVTNYIWTQSGVTFGQYKEWWRTRPDQTVYCCYFFMAIASVISSEIVVLFRYFIVMIFAAIFPLSVFLYTFRFTKGMGNSLMKFSFMAIFSQVPMVLFLVIGLKAYQDPSGWGVPAFRIMFGIASYLAIVCTPLIMLKVMHWIGGAVYAYSSRGGGKGVRFVSQLMRGKGVAQALITASGRYQTTHTLGMYERGGERMSAPGWSKAADGGGEFPGFPHRGIIGWSPDVYGKRGRMGRLRTGSTVAGVGGGDRAARPVTGLAGAMPSASLSNVTPQASRRTRQPTRIKPAPRPGGRGAGATGDQEGGGHGGGIPARAPSGAPPSRAPSGSPPGGDSTLTQSPGSSPHDTAPSGQSRRDQAPIAYSPTGESEAAEESAAEAEGKRETQQIMGDTSGRIAAIQKDTEKRKLALQLAAARKREGEKSLAAAPLGDSMMDEDDYDARPPTDSRFTGQITPPPKPPQEPATQTELPDWYKKAQTLGIRRSENLHGLSRVGEGQANQLLRDVGAARKSPENKDKTVDDLMKMALEGALPKKK